jgi:hypothetical protein
VRSDDSGVGPSSSGGAASAERGGGGASPKKKNKTLSTMLGQLFNGVQTIINGAIGMSIKVCVCQVPRVADKPHVVLLCGARACLFRRWWP